MLRPNAVFFSKIQQHTKPNQPLTALYYSDKIKPLEVMNNPILLKPLT